MACRTDALALSRRRPEARDGQPSYEIDGAIGTLYARTARSGGYPARSGRSGRADDDRRDRRLHRRLRSEEHTSELQSLMRISYAVFCLKKKNNNSKHQTS